MTDNNKRQQPLFSVEDMDVLRPKYHANGDIYWKELKTKKGKPIRKRTYSEIYFKNVKIKDDFEVRADILEQSRLYYSARGELIPILLSPDNILLNGYEQYLIAQENGFEKIPFIPLKISCKEAHTRRKFNKKHRRSKIRHKRQMIKR